MEHAAEQPAILSQQEMSEAVLRPFAGGSCCLYSRSYPGNDGLNEDAVGLLALPGGDAVLAVADGAGGQPAGEKASAAALEALQQSLQVNLGGGRDVRDAILSGFEAANRSVLELGVGAGTTLTVVAIMDRALRAYHVGDSEALMVGQRGKVKLHTMSHSPVGYAFAAGMLTARQAIHHEDRHLVSNLLGSEDMHIQVGSVQRMAVLDTLLLGSDGLFDNLHLHEITECVRRGPLLAAGTRLGELTLKRMAAPDTGAPSKPDDLTFILYRRTAPS